MIKIKKHDDLITQNIKKAMIKRGYKDQQSICDELFTKPMLSEILSGKRRTIDNLKTLADKLNCSLDYLVGISQVMDRDTDMQMICKTIHLSEESVHRLVHQFSQKELSALNELIYSIFSKDFFTSLHDYLFETDFDETVWHRDHNIHAEQIYISILSEDLKGIKKYSDESLRYYEQEIDRLTKMNERLDKSKEEDAPLYWKNISEIEEYSNTIHELEFARRIENELRRPMSELELDNFEINGRKNYLETEPEEEEDGNDGKE